jgi:hypothetical protein
MMDAQEDDTNDIIFSVVTPSNEKTVPSSSVSVTARKKHKENHRREACFSAVVFRRIALFFQKAQNHLGNMAGVGGDGGRIGQITRHQVRHGVDIGKIRKTAHIDRLRRASRVNILTKNPFPYTTLDRIGQSLKGGCLE